MPLIEVFGQTLISIYLGLPRPFLVLNPFGVDHIPCMYYTTLSLSTELSYNLESNKILYMDPKAKKNLSSIIQLFSKFIFKYAP